MRLLVLGGTRFIGDRIVRAAQRRGDEVTIVHRGSTEPADEPAADALADNGAHIHIDRADFAAIAGKVGALRPDAVIDTCAMTQADADSVLPHLPDIPVILLSSMDVYRAYELLLADEGGQPVPITEDADLRRARYPLRGHIEGRDDYDKLHVEPAYLARGGTVLRLGAVYGERDPQRREEFILRRVRAGRKRIPVGAGTWLWTRAYVADVASAVLAALDAPAVAAGQVFNVGELATDTMREHAQRILRSAECDAELVTVPDEDVPEDLAVTRSAAQHLLCDCGKLARMLSWQPADTELSVSRSVRWHVAHPPESPDTDFTPDDRALAGR